MMRSKLERVFLGSSRGRSSVGSMSREVRYLWMNSLASLAPLKVRLGDRVPYLVVVDGPNKCLDGFAEDLGNTSRLVFFVLVQFEFDQWAHAKGLADMGERVRVVVRPQDIFYGCGREMGIFYVVVFHNIERNNLFPCIYLE